MIPSNTLSSIPVYGNFLGARALSVSNVLDFEDGGIAINDPSKGLLYQRWSARIFGRSILLSSGNTKEFEVFSGGGISEISLTFDQNMRPIIAYVQDGMTRLRWFDTSLPGFAITDFPGAISPRVSLDDKSKHGIANSDIIFAYVKDNNLYYRQQRDRYLIERLLMAGANKRLLKIGMGTNNRFLFAFSA